MSRLNEVLRLVDGLLPGSLAEKFDVNSTTLTESRIMLITLSISVSLPLVSMIILLLLSIFLNKDFTLGLSVCIGLLVFVCIQHFFLHSIGKLKAMAYLYSIEFFFAIVATVYFTGGNISPVFVLLVTPPVISFLIAGRKEGLLSAISVGLVGFAFMLAPFMNIQFPQLMLADNIPYIKIGVWIMVTGLLYLLIKTYDVLLANRQLSKNESEDY